MKILLRNPKREVDVAGPLSVHDLPARLEINPEIRPVLSGGAGGRPS